MLKSYIILFLWCRYLLQSYPTKTNTIRIRLRIRTQIWKQIRYQWYPSVSDLFSSLRTRLTTLTKLCLPHHCSMFPPDISIRPTTPWSEIAKRDLISLCSWELLRNYDTVNTCYNYKDAVDTMRLLILLTASSSFASNSVSPIDLDTRITCCRTSSILRIALINSGKLILANRLMIRQKYLIMLMY